MSICELPSIGRRAVQEIETQRKQAKDSTLAVYSDKVTFRSACSIGCCDIVVALLPLLTTSSYCSLVLNCRQLLQCTKNRHTQQSAAIRFGVVRDNYLPAPPLWWGALSSSLSQEAIETVVPTRTAASKKIFMYLFMMSFVLRGEYSDLLYRMRR